MESKRSGAFFLVASVLLAACGLAVSSMLLVDDWRPRPVFCAETSGCEVLRHTRLASPWGVPLPALGVVGFVAIGVSALWPGIRARWAQIVLCAVGAGVAVTLLTVQFGLGVWCVFCCVADGCALASAVVASGRRWLAPLAPAPLGLAYAMAGLLPMAVGVPLFVGLRAPVSLPPPRPVPAAIVAEIAATPPGRATVIDFVDFECPFCRQTHAELEPLLRAHADRVRLLRIQVPLKIHPHAQDAARAAVCAEQFGRGDAMADALASAPVEQLTVAGCERIAVALGLPRADFRACVSAPSTTARLATDRAKFDAAGARALPTLWMGDREIVGAWPAEILASALDEALAKSAAR